MKLSSALIVSLCFASTNALAYNHLNQDKYAVWYSLSTPTKNDPRHVLNISHEFSIPADVSEKDLSNMYKNYMVLTEKQRQMFSNYNTVEERNYANKYPERHVAIFNTQTEAQSFEQSTIKQYQQKGIKHIDEVTINQHNFLDYSFNPDDVYNYNRMQSQADYHLFMAHQKQ